MPHNKRMKLTGAAILVSRGMKGFAGGPGSLSLSFGDGLLGHLFVASAQWATYVDMLRWLFLLRAVPSAALGEMNLLGRMILLGQMPH
jgi:hypothetical protein